MATKGNSLDFVFLGPHYSALGSTTTYFTFFGVFVLDIENESFRAVHCVVCEEKIMMKGETFEIIDSGWRFVDT